MIESRLTLRRTRDEAAYKRGTAPSSLHNPVVNAQLPTHPTPIKSPVAEPLKEGQQPSISLDRNPVDLERLVRKIITVADDLNVMLDWKALSANHQHLTEWLALYLFARRESRRLRRE